LRVILTPESATAVAQLKTGEIDMAPVSVEDAKGLHDQGFQIVSGAPAQTYLPIVGSMSPGNKGKPLSDLRVRRALSFAINRQELIDTLFPNAGATLPGPIRVGLRQMPDITDALRTKWSAWCQENYRYDPDEAKRLLTDAGYATGFTFEFWNLNDNDAPYLSDIVQAVAGYWQKLGVHADIKNVSSDTYGDKRNAREPGAAIGIMGIKTGSVAKASAGENVSSNFTSDGRDASLYGSADEARMDQAWKDYLGATDAATLESSLDKIIDIAANSFAQIP